MSESFAGVKMEETLVPWIGKVGKVMGVFLSQRLHREDFDITGKQWILLRILSRQDGQPQNDLAILTERNKASLVRLVNTMERKGLVKRVQDQKDRRINRIFLTEKGLEYYQSTLPTVLQSIDEVQEGISGEEIQRVICTMKKVMENITKYETNLKSN